MSKSASCNAYKFNNNELVKIHHIPRETLTNNKKNHKNRMICCVLCCLRITSPTRVTIVWTVFAFIYYEIVLITSMDTLYGRRRLCELYIVLYPSGAIIKEQAPLLWITSPRIWFSLKCIYVIYILVKRFTEIILLNLKAASPKLVSQTIWFSTALIIQE